MTTVPVLAPGLLVSVMEVEGSTQDRRCLQVLSLFWPSWVDLQGLLLQETIETEFPLVLCLWQNPLQCQRPQLLALLHHQTNQQ